MPERFLGGFARGLYGQVEKRLAETEQIEKENRVIEQAIKKAEGEEAAKAKYRETKVESESDKYYKELRLQMAEERLKQLKEKGKKGEPLAISPETEMAEEIAGGIAPSGIARVGPKLLEKRITTPVVKTTRQELGMGGLGILSPVRAFKTYAEKLKGKKIKSPESRQKALQWLKDNNAPATEANINDVIKKFNF